MGPGCGDGLGLVARRTPHRIPPGTAESASPLGEGEERRPELTGDEAARCHGVVGCPEDGRVRDAAPIRQAQGRLYARLDEELGVAAEVGSVVRHDPPGTLGWPTTNGVGRARTEDWIPAEDAGMTEGSPGWGWVLGGVVRHAPSKDSGSAHHERLGTLRQGPDRLTTNGWWPAA